MSRLFIRKRNFLLCLLLITAKVVQADETLLFITDIHFDPFFECKKRPAEIPCKTLSRLVASPPSKWPSILPAEIPNTYSQETNNALLSTGLRSLKPIVAPKRIKTIVIGGDVLAHNFAASFNTFRPASNPGDYQAFVYKTLTFVLQQIRRAFPNRRIYFVLGNNDSDTGNYIIPSNAQLQHLAKMLSGQAPPAARAGFRKSFSNGGYYIVPISKKLSLIGLSSIPLIQANAHYSQAADQLKWLEAEIDKAAASGRTAITLQHIPFGMQSLAAAHGHAHANSVFFDQALQKQYLDLYAKYPGVVRFILAGHTHMNALTLISGEIPQLTAVGFNAFFKNNPGVTVIQLNDAGDVKNYWTYVIDLACQMRWKLLSSLDGGQFGSSPDLRQILKNFPSSTHDGNVQWYRNNYNGYSKYHPQPIADDTKWKYYYCSIMHTEVAPYTACISSM